MEWLRYLNQYCPPYLLEVIRLSIWLLLLAIIFLPLERLFALHPQKFFRKEVASDLGYYFLNSILLGILLAVPLAILARAAHHFVPVSYIAAVATWPTWARVAAAMVIGEIGFYWGHRWSHEIPLLWRFHSIHHGPENMHWLISSRAHPVDMVFTRLCGLTLLYMTGLAAPMRGSATMIPLLVLLLGTVWGFFIHANLNWRFGPLEWLVATPAFHHWHHTNDGPEYINKNYAPMLPWVDRIFGTMYLPKGSRPARYGTDYPIPPGLFGQLLQPFGLAEADARRVAVPPSQELVKELP
jgi:sterol desaturase/sphingolipid hydroxylase (fatty acid hydroxylase superfamily)